MQPIRLLFETPQAAQEVAFAMQCEYDGCNMVTLPPLHDSIALKTAIELTGVDFCYDGDHYPLILPPLPPEIVRFKDEKLPPEQGYLKRELWSERSPL